MGNKKLLLLGIAALAVIYIASVAVFHSIRTSAVDLESDELAARIHDVSQEAEVITVEEQIDTFSSIDSECRKATETWSYEDPIPDCVFTALKQKTKTADKEIKLKTFNLLCVAEYAVRDRNNLVPGSCQVDYWNKKRLGILKDGQKLPEPKTDKN